MSRPTYTVESITAEEGVARLREDWDRLSRAAEMPNVFTTYDWFQAWYRRFANIKGVGNRQPFLLVLKKNGAITGISPLVGTVSSRFGQASQRLQFVSHEQEWDYNDLVLGDDVAGQTEAVADFLSHSAKEWDLIDLRDLRDAGNAVTHIESALKRAGLPYLLLREEERCPYMQIDGPWSAILNQRTRSTRRVFRRITQMIHEGMQVRIVDNPQQEPELLERLIAVERQKHVGGKISQPFLGKYPEVFQTLFDSLGPQGWIAIVLLESKDRLVAWQLLYRCGKSLWGYLTAFDHSFSSLSPGTMLIPAAIDFGFERGFDEFDFLNGEEPYKLRWATDFHQTYRLLIWNRRWLSRLRAYRNLRALPSPSTRDFEETM